MNLKTRKLDLSFSFGLSLFFSVLGLGIRLIALKRRDLWNDEIFQLNNTLGAFKPFWNRLAYGDMTSFPGEYLLTYPFVKIFGANKWALALPHIIFTVLVFYFLYLICRRYYKSFLGYLIAFAVVCFHEDLIFHSLEFRPYGVLCALMLMSFYFTGTLLQSYTRKSAGIRILIGLFYVLTIWFHAFGFIIVSLPFIYFYLSQGRRFLRTGDTPLWHFLLTILLIAGPVWFWYSLGPPDGETPAMRLAAGKHALEFAPSPFDGFGRFFNRIIFYNLIGFKPLYFLLGIIIVSAIVPFKERSKMAGFFLTMILMPIEIILFAALINNYWFLQRQYLFLSPLFAFLLGWMWDAVFCFYRETLQTSGRRKWGNRAVAGLILAALCWIGGMAGLITYLLK